MCNALILKNPTDICAHREIDIGDQKIKLVHARNSHTDGDTLVYLPGKKILFAGDILPTNSSWRSWYNLFMFFDS